MDAFYLWWSGLGFVLGGCAAAGARALLDFSRTELQQRCQRQNKPHRFGQITHHDLTTAEGLRAWQVLGLMIGIANGAILILRNNGLPAYELPYEFWPSWLGLGIVSLLCVVWLPLVIGRIWSTALVFELWPVWRVAAQLAWPITSVTHFGVFIVRRLAGRPAAQPTEETIEEEIRSIVSEGEREGLLEEDAREMIEGVFDLSDADVSQILTPRIEIISLPLDSTWDEIVAFAADSGHSRLPIHGKSRDEIVGVLHIRDLLTELAKPVSARRPFAELLRKPYFVPETKAVNDLLQEFQRSRNHLAIVLDEYGGVAGLVTIEDVLEEIVGDIADEHDDFPTDALRQISETRWEALAKTRIQEVNEQLQLELPEEADFDTLGGFVFHEMGRIPHVGEELTRGRIKIRVLDATRRRIDRLLLEILPTETTEQTAPPAPVGSE